jgi:hypothetical protein
MKYSVYIHINKLDGKKYVGITRCKPETRWRKGEGYRDNSYFYAAIKKYGWDNFDHIVVEVDTEEEMFELEKEYIKFYNTTDRNIGYNISYGGEAGCFKDVNSGSKEYYRKRYKENPELYKKRVMRHYYLNRDEIIKVRKERYNKNKDEINKNRRFKKKKDYPICTLW